MSDTTVLDSLGMWEATFGLPEQVEAATDAGRGLDGLPDKDDVENVLVLGMGGSGIAGDVLMAAAGPYIPVPVVVSKNYNVPAFVGETTLVFAVSFSGNTEETLEAADICEQQGANLVMVTSGGQLAKLGDRIGAPIVPIADGIPMPRVGLGAVAIPPLIVLEEIGLFSGATEWVKLAIDQLKARRDQLRRPESLAAEIARRLGRTLPIIYGGGGLGSVAASRWKAQINENVKEPAFSNYHPELCHNEVCGWGQHGDLTRQVFSIVHLRHDFEHPQIERRFDLTGEIMEEVVHDVIEVRAEGEGQLAQLFDLILIGDVVSLHLAAQEGLDPGPVPILMDLKRALAGG